MLITKMWAKGHRLIKIPRNDFPNLSEMIRQQTENPLQTYQPDPRAGHRVLIKTEKDGWVVFKIVKRLKFLEKDKWVSKYEGYFLVESTDTNLKAIVPLKSGYGWEIIHTMLSKNKIASIQERIEDPSSSFNELPLVPMHHPSNEELENLLQLASETTISIDVIDTEIGQFFSQYQPNVHTNPNELFIGELPGPVLHSPPPGPRHEEHIIPQQQLSGAHEGMLTVTPTLTRRQFPRIVKGMIPSQLNDYSITHPGPRILQSVQSGVATPEVTEQISTDKYTSTHRVPTPAEISDINISRIVPGATESRPASVLSAVSTDILPTRETPAPLYDEDETGVNEDHILENLEAPVSAGHILSKFLETVDKNDPRYEQLVTFKRHVRSTYTSARNLKFTGLKLADWKDPAQTLHIQAMKVKNHVHKMDMAVMRLRDWIMDPPEELRLRKNEDTLEFLEIFVSPESGQYLQFRSNMNAVIFDCIKILITLEDGAKLSQDLVQDSDFELIIQDFQQNLISKDTLEGHLDEATRKGIETVPFGPEPDRGVPRHVPLKQPSTFNDNNTLIQNKLFNQDNKTIQVTLGHLISSTISRIESTNPILHKSVNFKNLTHSPSFQTPIMSVRSTPMPHHPAAAAAAAAHYQVPVTYIGVESELRTSVPKTSSVFNNSLMLPNRQRQVQGWEHPDLMTHRRLSESAVRGSATLNPADEHVAQTGLLGGFTGQVHSDQYAGGALASLHDKPFDLSQLNPQPHPSTYIQPNQGLSVPINFNPMLSKPIPSINLHPTSLHSTLQDKPSILAKENILTPAMNLGNTEKTWGDHSLGQNMAYNHPSNIQIPNYEISKLRLNSNQTPGGAVNYEGHVESLPLIDLTTVESRLIRRQLKIIVDATICLEKNVRVLHQHAVTLTRPNSHTDNQLRLLNKNHDLLQEKVTSIYKEHLHEIEKSIITENILNQINHSHDKIRFQLFDMQNNCSTAAVTPSINANQLNKIKLPEIHVSRWRSPGFYKIIQLIYKHIQEYPFEGSFYPKTILAQLKTTEPTVYANLISGTPPESVHQIFRVLSIHTQPPKRVESMSIQVLKSTGQLTNPTATTKIQENLEREIKKSTVLQSILDNITAMFQYFRVMYEDDNSFLTWIMSGCFSSSFCSALLQSMPVEEQMSLNRDTMQMDYKSQLEFYYQWNYRRLNEMYRMSNNCDQSIHDNSNTKPKKPTQDDTAERSDAIGNDPTKVILRKPRQRAFQALGAQTEEIPKDSNSNKNNQLEKFEVKIATTKFNQEQLRLFAIYLRSDKTPKHTFKDEDDNIPHQLDFANAHHLIQNPNLTEEQKTFIIMMTANRRGCLVCITLVELFGLKYKLLPHLHLYSNKRNYLIPTVRSNRCPNLMRMSLESRTKLVKKIPTLCQLCLGPFSDSGCNRCSSPHQTYRPMYCKTSKTNALLCKCVQCISTVEKFKEDYNQALSKFKDPTVRKINLDNDSQKLLPLAPTLMVVGHVETDDSVTETTDTSGIVENTDIIEQLEKKKNMCDELSQDLPEPNIPAFLKNLRAADSIIQTPVLLQNIQFEEILSTKKILPPAKERIYFKLFIRAANGHFIPAVYDTGAKSSIFTSDILQDQSIFLNREININGVMQVVGGRKTEAKFHQVLLPLKGNFQYQLVQGVSLPKIVDATPNLDLSDFMEEAWEDYVTKSKSEGKKPIEKAMWPSGTEVGGKISALIGIGELQFEILHCYRGIQFITHNLDTKNPIAYGGSLRTTKEDESLEQTILMAENESCPLIDPHLDVFSHPMTVQDEFCQEKDDIDQKAGCTTKVHSSAKTTKTKNWLHYTFDQILKGKFSITTKIVNSASVFSCSLRNILSLERTCGKQHHTKTKKMSREQFYCNMNPRVMLEKCIPPTSYLKENVDADFAKKDIHPGLCLPTDQPSVSSNSMNIQNKKPETHSSVTDIEDGRHLASSPVTKVQDGRPIASSPVTDIQDGRHMASSPVTDAQDGRHLASSSVTNVHEERHDVTDDQDGRHVASSSVTIVHEERHDEDIHPTPTSNHDPQDNICSHISSFSLGKLRVMNNPSPNDNSNTEIKSRNGEPGANSSITEKEETTHPKPHISRKELDEWWSTEFPSDSSPESSPSKSTNPPHETNSDSSARTEHSVILEPEPSKNNKSILSSPTPSEFESDYEDKMEAAQIWLLENKTDDIIHTSPTHIPHPYLRMHEKQIMPPGPENYVPLPLGSPITSPPSSPPLGSPINSPPSTPPPPPPPEITLQPTIPQPPPPPNITLRHLLTGKSHEMTNKCYRYVSKIWGDIGKSNSVKQSPTKNQPSEGEYVEYYPSHKEEPETESTCNPIDVFKPEAIEEAVSPPRCSRTERANIRLIQNDSDMKLPRYIQQLTENIYLRKRKMPDQLGHKNKELKLSSEPTNESSRGHQNQLEITNICQTLNWVPYSIDLSKTMEPEKGDTKEKKPRGGAKKTYSEVTKETCDHTPSQESEKTECKKFFGKIGVEIPEELEEKSIIFTASNSNNCFFYAVGRSILKDYNHNEVAGMRNNLRRYLLDNFEEIYNKNFVLYPTSVVNSYSGEIPISNATEMKDYIASDSFTSHYIEEQEIKSFSDLYAVTIAVTKLKYCSRKGKEIAYTRLYNESLTTPIRILLYQEHYSSLIANTDSLADRHPTDQHEISLAEFPELSKPATPKSPIKEYTSDKIKPVTNTNQCPEKPQDEAPTENPNVAAEKSRISKSNKDELPNSINTAPNEAPVELISNRFHDEEIMKMEQTESARDREIKAVVSVDSLVDPTETSPQLKRKTVENPLLLCNSSRPDLTPGTASLTRPRTSETFLPKTQIDIFLNLGESFTSILKNIDKLLGHKEKSYEQILIGKFFFESNVDKNLKEFKNLFREDPSNFGISAFQIKSTFKKNCLMINVTFQLLAKILQKFIKFPDVYNSELNPQIQFTFENKILKAHLQQIQSKINGFDAGLIEKISLVSEDHRYSLEMPPSFFCDLSFKPLVNPQVEGIIPHIDLSGEVAKPFQSDGCFYLLDYQYPGGIPAKYLLLKSLSDQRFFAKMNKLGDRVKIKEIINHQQPRNFLLRDILKSKKCFVCDKNFKTQSYLAEHLALQHQIIKVYRFPKTNEKFIKCENSQCSMPSVKYHKNMGLYYAFHSFIFCPGSRLPNFVNNLNIYKIPIEFFMTHVSGRKICHFFKEKSVKPNFSNITSEDVNGTYSELFYHESDSEDGIEEELVSKEPPDDHHPPSIAKSQSPTNVLLGSEAEPIESDDSQALDTTESIWCEINHILVENEHLTQDQPIQSKIPSNINSNSVKSKSEVLLFNKPKALRAQNNKKIAQSEEFHETMKKKNVTELIDTMLMPVRDPHHRCGTCSRCITCAPLESLDRSTRLSLLKGRENSTIMENIQIIDDPNTPGKLRVCVKLPSDHDNPGGPTQKEQVIREFDRKMCRLDPVSKASLQQELDKYIRAGYVVRFDSLPSEIKDKILSQPVRYVSSVAAFKESQSTPSRLCLNFSSPDVISKKSENSSSLGGKIDLSIAKTARFFKSYRCTAVGDVRKYYNNFLLQTNDIAKQFFCWRTNLSINAPIEFFLFTRLTFGHIAAGTLADGGILKIISFGESHCKFCNGRFSHSQPTQSQGNNCRGVSHLLARIFDKTYIDDFFFATHSSTALHQLIKYTVALFNLFSIQFKGIHCSLESFRTDVETLDEKGRMNTLGYVYIPSTDVIKIKPICLHNGRKIRGKVMPSRNQKNELIPLKSIVLAKKEDITFQKINDIFSGKPKTLRVVVQVASAHYDPIGFAAPLMSQIRHTVSLAMKECEGDWDQEVSIGLWDFLVVQLVELYRTVLYDYRRFPENAVSRPGNAILVITVDASYSLMITAHLIYFSMDLKHSWVNLITNKSFLASNLSSIPHREIHAQSLGSQLARKIALEIGDLLQAAYVFNDSRVAISWCNNTSNRPLNLFVSNRVAVIQSSLQQTQEAIYDSHMEQDIESSIRETTWRSDFFKDILHWSCSDYTTADRGTKYKRFDDPGAGSLIIADQVHPTSHIINGMEWMQNINQEIARGKLISARALGNNLKNPSETETEIYEAGFKKERAEKIKTHSHVILDNKFLPTSAISEGKSVSSLLMAEAPDLYEETSPEVADPCMLADNLDDFTTISLLGVAANGQETPSELVQYIKKMKEIHKTPCQVKLPPDSNSNESEFIQIQHIMNPEKIIKTKFSLSLRILFLVVLASLKWKRSIDQKLALCKIKTDLTTGLLDPSKLNNFWPIVAEKPPTTGCSHHWLEKLNPLPAFSGHGSVWENLSIAWKTSSDKQILETKQDLCFTRRDLDGRISILYQKDLPVFIRRHPRMKFVIRKFSCIYNLMQVKDFSDQIKNQRIISALIIMERLQSEFFVGKIGNSYLSSFILRDLTTCYKFLIGNPTLKLLFKDILEDRDNWLPTNLLKTSIQFNPMINVFDQNPAKCSRVSRKNLHNFSIINCMQNEHEFSSSYRCLGIFLSYLLSHELVLTFPSSFLKKITIQNIKLPGILFLKSRFHNFQNDLNLHEKQYREFLIQQGVNPCPLVLSPFSALAYSLVNEKHQVVPSLHRPSVVGSHLGYTRVYLEVESIARILQLKRLVKFIRQCCVQCKKQLQRTLPDYPGKTPKIRTLRLNSFENAVMIDLLPSIRVKTTVNQKSTRNSTTTTCHVLIGVDVATKYSNFVIISSRNSLDIQNGLSALCCKMGKKATTFFSDRESSIVSIADSAHWSRYSNGVFSGDVIIRFIPALAESHSRSGLVESRVGSIKRSIGSLDLGTFDTINLNIFLELLFSNLNSIPIFSKVLASKKHLFDNVYTKNISPNHLYGKMPLFILESDDDEAILEKRKLYSKMIDQVAWKMWAIINRDTDQLDRKIEKLTVGSVVLFRKIEKGFGPTNRFYLGTIVSISSPSIDGINRSVFIQSFVEQDQISESPELKEVPRLYIYHRKISDIIIIETEEEKIAGTELLDYEANTLPREGSLSSTEPLKEKDIQLGRQIMTRSRRKANGPALSVLLVLSRAELSMAESSNTPPALENVLSYIIQIILFCLLAGGIISTILYSLVKKYQKHSILPATEKEEKSNSVLNFTSFRSCQCSLTRSVTALSSNIFTMIACFILHIIPMTCGFHTLGIPSRKQDLIEWAVTSLIQECTDSLKRQISIKMEEITSGHIRPFSTTKNIALRPESSIHLIIFTAFLCCQISSLLTCFKVSSEDNDPYEIASAPPMELVVRRKKRKAPPPPQRSISKGCSKKSAGKALSLPFFLVLCLMCEPMSAGRSMDMVGGNRYPFRTTSTTISPVTPQKNFLHAEIKDYDTTPSEPSHELPDYKMILLRKQSTNSSIWDNLSKEEIITVTLITGLSTFLLANILFVICCLLICGRVVRWWKRKDLKRKTKRINLPREESETPPKMDKEEDVYMSMNRKKLNISRPLNIHPYVPFSPLSSIYDVPRETERDRFTEIFPEPSKNLLNSDIDEACLSSRKEPTLADYQDCRSPRPAKINSTKYHLITLSLVSLFCFPGCLASPGTQASMDFISEDILNNYSVVDAHEDVTIIEVEKGAMASLHCSIQEIYLGKVSWVLLDKINPPRSSQVGEVLILHKVSKDHRVKCLVDKKYQQYEQKFLVRVSTEEQDSVVTIPEYIEAFSCAASDSNPIMRLSNAGIKDCDKRDFQTYEEEKPTEFMLITRNRVKRVQVKRCSIQVHNKIATCIESVTGGFRTAFNGPVFISGEECQTLHEKGSLVLQLGPDVIKFEQISIERPLYEVMFLSSSNIDRSLPKNPCKQATKDIYFGPPANTNKSDIFWEHFTGSKYKSALGFVVMADISISIDLEPAILNFEEKSLSIPKFGKILKYESSNETISWSSRKYGGIVFKVPKEKNSGYELASQVIPGRLFKDKSSSLRKPDIAVLNVLNNTKILALQINDKVNILDRTLCKNTHIKNLYLCQDKLVGDLELNSELVQTLGSQANLIQQINSGESTASILQHICLNRHTLLSMSLNDFPTQGSAPFQMSRGLVLIDRGEESLIFQCKQVLVEPVLTELEYCTQELAVYIEINKKKEIRYLTPRRRILVEIPRVTLCNAEFPIKFHIDENTSLCQKGIGKSIEICKTSNELDPTAGLAEAKLQTLLTEENRLSATSLVSSVRQLVQSEILASSYSKSLDAAVIYNQKQCSEDPILCRKAFLQPASLRRELFRQSLSLVSYLVNSTFYQIAVLIATIWALSAIISGLITLIIRLKNLCHKRTTKYNSCQLVVSLISELDTALNPMSLTRQKFKQKCDALTAEVQSQRAQLNNLLQTNQALMTRMTALENRFSDSQDIEPHYLSLPIARKKFATIKKNIRPGILRRKRQKYVTFSSQNLTDPNSNFDPEIPFPPIPTDSELACLDRSDESDENSSLLSDSMEKTVLHKAEIHPNPFNIPSRKPRLVKKEPTYPAPVLSSSTPTGTKISPTLGDGFSFDR